MQSIEYQYYYSGPLLFKTKLLDKDLDKLNAITNSNIDYRDKLAADMSTEEYQLDRLFFQEIVEPYLQTFKQAYLHWYGKECKDLKTVSAWINKMKAHSYNPPHIHTNCKFSSVIFMNDLSEELLQETKDYKGTHGGGPASLNFLFGINKNETFIEQYNYLPKKGDYFIFPALLTHYVFPYKTNFTRISLAANYDF